MGGVPSIPTDTSRKIQVIAAGYSRTGTMSMSLALEQLLQGPVMHGGTQVFGREDAYLHLWCKVLGSLDNKPVMMKYLREATAGFVAISDAPGLSFINELLELYPDAKVVLVTRDRDRWYDSMAPIMKNVAIPLPILGVLMWPFPGWRWFPQYIRRIAPREKARLGEKFTPERLDNHNDWVRRNVPADRLLEMELKEGWAPLAKFLDLPEPETPFPRENDAAAADAFTKKIFTSILLTWTAILGTAGAVAWQGVKYCKRGSLGV